MTDPTLNLTQGKTTPRPLDVLERIAAALESIATDTTSMAEDLASLNGRDSVWRAS